MSELLAYRDRFPILEHTTYLINHSLGAMPAEAARRLRQFADEWATRGARAWGEGWWDTPLRVGDVIGSIVGVAARIAGPGRLHPARGGYEPSGAADLSRMARILSVRSA